MNWNKIKEYQEIIQNSKDIANKHLTEATVEEEEKFVQDLAKINLKMFKKEFDKKLQFNFVTFIIDNPKICRQDICFTEFDTHLKEDEEYNDEIKGFDINDQSHLNYLLEIVNKRFSEIPFYFSPTHIKKYLTLSKFQRQVKKSCG